MPDNAFIGQATPPTAPALAEVLGPAATVWEQVLAVAREFGADTNEWKSYSVKTGWALRVKRKQRTMVWLAPSRGCFTVLFILGAAAIQAARESGLSLRVRKLLDNAPKYPEGTGLRMVVKTARDLSVLRRLTEIKAAN